MDEVRWLIAREIPHMRRFARALLRDSDAADDLVQDALERALRKHHLWLRRGKLRSWLFQVLYRLYLNGAAQRRRWRDMRGLDDLPGALATPAAQEQRLAVQDALAALDRLPDEQRAAIMLVALEGVGYDEAAWILDVPVGTIRSRLSRGREALREMGLREPRPDAPLRRVK